MIFFYFFTPVIHSTSVLFSVIKCSRWSICTDCPPQHSHFLQLSSVFLSVPLYSTDHFWCSHFYIPLPSVFLSFSYHRLFLIYAFFNLPYCLLIHLTTTIEPRFLNISLCFIFSNLHILLLLACCLLSSLTYVLLLSIFQFVDFPHTITHFLALPPGYLVEWWSY